MAFDLHHDSPLLDRPDGGRLRFAVPRTGVVAPVGVEPDGPLLAGAAEVDITPPPGLPKAGYSANATDGIGFRTRLRARVLHLHRGPTSLAIVQCDLLGGSAVLSHLVARHLAERTDIPLAGLMIGATHTHAGPGQFLGTDFYNRFASNRAGFDPAWTQFLATRIADAVVEAHDRRVPAEMAVGSTPVWGLTRNRSLDPHVQNGEVTDKRLDPQRKWVNVDPLLHLVRVDAVGGGPLAAMVVFGVHGTGIPNRAPEYNADLWAYVVGALGDGIAERSGVRPVVGAIEGTHADIAPAIRPGRAGHLEARRIGRGIGDEAAVLWERLGDRLTAEVALGAGLHEVDLESERTVDDVTLPRRPAVGAALVAGAHENVTPVLHRLPAFRPGNPKPWRTRHPQGPKWVLGSRWLQPLLLPLRGFPRILPLQVLRLGDAALVGMPFEVTIASGRRMVDAVGGAMASAGVERVMVTSVANEYSGYVATAEEYQRQHYEGGHTLYGPQTQPFVTAHVARLAARVADGVGLPVTLAADERRFDLKIGSWFAEESPDDPDVIPRRFAGPATFADPDDVDDATWSQEWFDVAPAALRWCDPMVQVEVATGGGDDTDEAWQLARGVDGRPADDQGWALEVLWLGPASPRTDRVPAGTHRYRVRWHGPRLEIGLRHRFVLLDNNGRPRLEGGAFD